MKKYLLFTVLSILIFTNIHSQELDKINFCSAESYSCDTYPSNKNNFYVKVFSGLNYFGLSNLDCRDYTVTNQNGYIVSGALGYRISNALRIESEYSYRKNILKMTGGWYYNDKIKVFYKSLSIMTNLIYDLPVYKFTNSTNIQPFIGGGIGYKFICSEYKKNHKYFSWQVITGLSYNLGVNTDISLEYRFNTTFVSKGEYNNSIGLGLTYNFG